MGRVGYLLTWNLRHMAGAVARRRIENELRQPGYDPPDDLHTGDLKAAYD